MHWSFHVLKNYWIKKLKTYKYITSYEGWVPKGIRKKFTQNDRHSVSEITCWLRDWQHTLTPLEGQKAKNIMN